MAESSSAKGVPFLAPVDAELSARISWLIQLRWLAVAGTALAILLASLLLPQVLPTLPLMAVTAFIGLYNAVFYAYLRAGPFRSEPEPAGSQSVRFVYIQIGLDLFCLTLLLHFAGGVENPFWTFYVLHVIIASILLSRRSAFAFAGLATVLFGGLVSLEYLGLLPHINLRGIIDAALFQRETFLAVVAIAFVTTLLFAALMATTIVGRLRVRDGDLLQCTLDLDSRSQQLSEASRRLAEFHEVRNRFIVVLTHDLRAPVAAIQGYLRLILSGSVPTEKHEDMIAHAERRATELLDRTANILILSEIREKLTKTEVVDLGEVLAQVLDEMGGAIESKRLNVRADAPTPAACTLANREQIRQVWMNLISNAIKYTPAGGHIDVGLTQTADLVVGTVRDSGIGIEPEDQARVFDEFFRADAAKRVEQYGTGLGLPIAKQIVEGYGGRITLSSVPGQGSTFTFTLPCQRGGPAMT